MQITPNQHFHVKIFIGENYENNLHFLLGPFSKQMDKKYDFLDFKSSEIDKLCLNSRNQVNFVSFTLPLIIHICPWRPLKKTSNS